MKRRDLLKAGAVVALTSGAAAQSRGKYALYDAHGVGAVRQDFDDLARRLQDHRDVFGGGEWDLELVVEADSYEDAFKQVTGVDPMSVAGKGHSRWVLGEVKSGAFTDPVGWLITKVS